MTDWPDVQVCVVLPSGVATLPFEGGAITCRVTVGHLDAPATGLIAEMDAGGDPVPWRSALVRDEALWSIETRIGLDEDVRRRLMAHVRRTPWFDD
jgi:hypothetical protein